MKTVEVYMCKVDWDYEIGNAAGGNKVFATAEDIKHNLNCVHECGIVKVKVTFVEVIQPATNWSV